MNPPTLVYDGRLYQPRPRFRTWLEMEDELGSLEDLRRRLTSGRWRLSELVTAVQILLTAADCDCDYIALGDDMLRRGLEAYRATVEKMVAAAVGGALERTAP